MDGLILMGPFGSGKSYLGNLLQAKGIASYTELEPIVYELFGQDGDLDIEKATEYIRIHYYSQLSSNKQLSAFESTGITQRPLLLEVMQRYEIALVWVQTPKDICLERVVMRNQRSKRPIEHSVAEQFYDDWTQKVAPTYDFAFVVDGTDEGGAIQDIQQFLEGIKKESE